MLKRIYKSYSYVFLNSIVTTIYLNVSAIEIKLSFSQLFLDFKIYQYQFVFKAITRDR